jgi:hypothetical protein
MSDETVEIVDQRGNGPVERGRRLPKIIVGEPAHGSLPHPVARPIIGEGIVAEEPGSVVEKT